MNIVMSELIGTCIHSLRAALSWAFLGGRIANEISSALCISQVRSNQCPAQRVERYETDQTNGPPHE